MEGAGLGALIRLSREWDGPDLSVLARKLLAGEALAEPEALRDWVSEALNTVRTEVAGRIARLLIPGTVCGIAGALLGRRGIAMPALRLVCRVAGACLLTQSYLEARTLAEGIIKCASALANGIAPVLISVAALTGRLEASAFVTPMTALCAAILEEGFSGCGLRLCGLLAVMAAAGNLSDELRLAPLFRLGRKMLLWGGALVVAAFMGLMSAQGLLSAGGDGAASRAARFAVESLVPVIGSEISDALGSLAVSASAARNAVGVAALALAAGACAKPLLGIAACAVAAKLAGALGGVAGEAGIARMGEQFGEAMELMLAMCLGGVLLVLLLTGGTLALCGLYGGPA